MIYKLWLGEWLENYVKPTHKERTYLRYKLCVDNHICSTIGNLELKDITPIHLQHLITNLLESGNQKTKKGLSASSVNLVISVIQSSLKTANMLGLTEKYIADKIVRPKVAEKRIECFSLIEQKIIEEYVLNSKKLKLYGIIICLYTGLRIGELLALQFANIDFAKCVMTISKTCHDSKKGQRVVETPKTVNSNRVIPIPKQIISLIKTLKKNSNCEEVISNKNKPIQVRSYQRSFELLLKKLKLNHKGFHSLRHTFATRALECGMDVKTLSEILGHKNANITLNRYVHSMFEYKQNMMNKLGKNLQRMCIE